MRAYICIYVALFAGHQPSFWNSSWNATNGFQLSPPWDLQCSKQACIDPNKDRNRKPSIHGDFELDLRCIFSVDLHRISLNFEAACRVHIVSQPTPCTATGLLADAYPRRSWTNQFKLNASHCVFHVYSSQIYMPSIKCFDWKKHEWIKHHKDVRIRF